MVSGLLGNTHAKKEAHERYTEMQNKTSKGVFDLQGALCCHSQIDEFTQQSDLPLVHPCTHTLHRQGTEATSNHLVDCDIH